MPFNSLAYAILLAISVGAMAVVPWRAQALIVASLVFYAVAGPLDTTVFLAAVTVNWLIQARLPPGRWRVTAAAIFNIGLIGYFKYRNLLIGDVSHAGSYLDTALPLGISFYSLQALAYHIDVARGVSKPARAFFEFFLFKAFYPQLVAGPIVRARQLLPQVQRLFDGQFRRHRLLAFGLSLIVLGLCKKIVFADSLGPLVDDIFATRPATAYVAWLGVTLFAFQIYFDFSGYSDIAIGSAYLLGIRLPWNFRTPYLSVGPREFWQRWHISLSTWIRDYLYLPLGGSRGHPARAVAVLVATMALAGLWHGANNTFVVWGAIWGLYILAGRVMRRDGVPIAIRWPAHMVIVLLLWVFFRSPNLGYALDYLSTMLTFRGGLPAPVDDAAPPWQVALGVALLFVLHWGESRLQRRSVIYALRRLDGPAVRAFLVGLALLLILIPSYNISPFIYFRF
jgi:alginate O-acetyltransferase complex protein AlgI